MKPAKAPFCITFDNLGSAQEVYEGRMTRQADNDPIVQIGVPRILKLLKDVGVKATFFVEGWNVLHNTDTVRAIADAGHDIGLHGWTHENYSKISLHDQERGLWDSIAAFRLLGIKPVGFRAPGGSRPEPLVPKLIEMGLGFDSSVDWDNVRREPRLLESGLPNVPILPGCDYVYYYMHDGDRQPATLRAALFKEIELAADTQSLCHFVFHPFVTCTDDARFAVLEDVLKSVVADPRFEILTVDDVARRLH